jgi:ferredoxin
MAEEQKENISKISRREFLKDAGLVVGGATIGSMAVMAACSGGDGTSTVTKTTTVTTTKTATGGTSTVTVTSPPVTKIVEVSAAVPTINITVNGEQHTLQVAPWDTLRVVLREQLGLISIKDMCYGYGACGSCTVIMDGRPILSCKPWPANATVRSLRHPRGLPKPITHFWKAISSITACSAAIALQASYARLKLF